MSLPAPVRIAIGCWLLLAGMAAPLTASAAPGGSTIAGTVVDRTTGKPSAGDTVALIGFAQGMQVAAQTKTDASGRYRLEAPAAASTDAQGSGQGAAGQGADNGPAGMHLIRVSHQKAAYFQPVPNGAHTVDVDVYDVAASVEGVTTEADVLSLQTAPGAVGQGGALRVTEDFFVRNDSKPARTQLSDHAYEFFLPEGAKLEDTAAMGPGGMPVESSPVPLAGQGHYAFVFPVRPGATRFRVNYTLPYDGKTMGWTQREALPTENLVVLLPKSMRFTPDGTDWQPVPANPDAQTFVRKGVAPGAPTTFAIGGEGELPREAQNGNQNGGGSATLGAGGNVATSGSMAADTRPGGGLGPPVDTPDPLNRYKPWLLGGLGVLLLAGAVWLLRGRPAAAAASERLQDRVEEPRALRPALERALLALEREHALGLVAEEEYTESRTALQRALHRALAREAAGELSSSAAGSGNPGG